LQEEVAALQQGRDALVWEHEERCAALRYAKRALHNLKRALGRPQKSRTNTDNTCTARSAEIAALTEAAQVQADVMAALRGENLEITEKQVELQRNLEIREAKAIEQQRNLEIAETKRAELQLERDCLAVRVREQEAAADDSCKVAEGMRTRARDLSEELEVVAAAAAAAQVAVAAC